MVIRNYVYLRHPNIPFVISLGQRWSVGEWAEKSGIKILLTQPPNTVSCEMSHLAHVPVKWMERVKRFGNLID